VNFSKVERNISNRDINPASIILKKVKMDLLLATKQVKRDIKLCKQAFYQKK